MTTRILIAVAAALVLLSGCSDSVSPPSYGGEDGLAIARMIDELNDDRRSPKRMAKWIAPGVKLPAADLKKLSRYALDVVGKPAVTGDEGTAQIAFRPEAGGPEPEPKEWSFVREGGAWKIKAAPLP